MLVENQDLLRLAAPTADILPSAIAPNWLDGVEAFHRATPRVTVLAADAIIVGGVVLAGGGQVRVEALAAAAAFLVVGGVVGLYGRRNTLDAQGLAWYLRGLPVPLLAMAAVLSVTGAHTAATLLAPVAAVAAVLTLLRGLAWLLVARARRRQVGLEETLVVGPSGRTEQVARRIDAFPEAGLRLAGSYAPTNTNGDRSRARALLGSGRIRHILVAAEAHDERLVEECVRWSGGSGVEVGLVLPVGSAFAGVARIGDLGVIPLGRAKAAGQFLWAKRLIDIVGAATLLFLLAPVFLIASLAVYLYDRGPVFYRQRRVGLDNREFTIWKFRSMVPGADQLNDWYAHANMANGLLFKLPDDPRVTAVGNLMRRLSIDELPQLINVVAGDMSLVGPRPLPVDPDDFDSVAAKRHRVRPGITGPWQVAGGHVLGYDDMIRLDLAYVETWSLRRDLWLLLMTIPTVLVRRSAY